MKKIIIALVICLFHFDFAIANPTIVFIDMDKIISTSKPGSYIRSQLNDINLKNLEIFKTKAKKLKDQEIKLISQKNLLTELDFQTGINKLKLEIKNYNNNRDKVNNDLNKLRISNTNKLLKLINPILLDYSNDKSILFILNKKNLVIGKTELDITDEIIKIINKEIKQFKIQ